jgi:dUTP pyrophosphatase|tara:strand:+ start:6060 stop:6551 length:492 start_codon:yes stop_codon:yes gene_type:complete
MSDPISMFTPMTLSIKAANPVINSLYENHTTYHEGDSGIDLFVIERTVIPARALGFKIDHQICCEATVGPGVKRNVSYYLYPRSSIGKTPLRMSNSVGIMDAGYRGTVIGQVDNLSDEDYIVEANTRLFQICPPTLNNPINIKLINNLTESTRGEGGIGSTGS